MIFGLVRCHIQASGVNRMFMGRRLRRLVLASEKGRVQHGCGQKMGVVSKKKRKKEENGLKNG